jgi:DNA-nicking Smr family endonuclease
MSAAPPRKPPPPDPEHAPEDAELFRREMAGTTPLNHSRTEPYRRPPPPRLRPQPDWLREDPGATVELSENEVETGDYLEFARPGVQQRLLQDLRRGELEPGLELDLHGLTVSYAQETLDVFLAECARRRIRCARIIHGKGRRSENRQPILKQKLNYWLRLREEVLAFCSAPRRDGGTGATYVLLRNPLKAARRR